MEEKKWAYEIVNGKAIIPQGTKKIVANAFRKCKELISVEIPEGVTVICEHAFDDCINLENITLPKSLEYIDRYAFSCCESLRELTIGDKIKNIDSNAFSCSAIHCITCYKEEAFEPLLEAIGEYGSVNKVIVPNIAKYAEALRFRDTSNTTFEDFGGMTYHTYLKIQREEEQKAREAEEKAEEKKRNKQMICVAIVMLLCLIYALLTEG